MRVSYALPQAAGQPTRLITFAKHGHYLHTSGKSDSQHSEKVARLINGLS